MYVDTRYPDEYIGTIVYVSYNPKTLYIIDAVAKVRDFDIYFVLKDANGVQSNVSSLQLKDFKQLVEETETTLKNHKARIWSFTTKLGLDSPT